MNSQKIFELFLDGAYHVTKDCRLYHPSFRKGFRSMTSGNISLSAAKTKLQKINRLQCGMENDVYVVRATSI